LATSGDRELAIDKAHNQRLSDSLGDVQVPPSRRHIRLLLPSARALAPHEMKDATELAVGVPSARFEFDCGRRGYLL